MGKNPFFKLYTSDFLADTAGLSSAECCLYIKLLCQISDKEGAVARDDSRLTRRFGLTKPTFRKSLKSLIDIGLITEKDGRL